MTPGLFSLRKKKRKKGGKIALTGKSREPLLL
jgi:hypothetical protein